MKKSYSTEQCGIIIKREKKNAYYIFFSPLLSPLLLYEHDRCNDRNGMHDPMHHTPKKNQLINFFFIIIIT
jgi:hypothetical protein